MTLLILGLVNRLHAVLINHEKHWMGILSSRDCHFELTLSLPVISSLLLGLNRNRPIFGLKFRVLKLESVLLIALCHNVMQSKLGFPNIILSLQVGERGHIIGVVHLNHKVLVFLESKINFDCFNELGADTVKDHLCLVNYHLLIAFLFKKDTIGISFRFLVKIRQVLAANRKHQSLNQHFVAAQESQIFLVGGAANGLSFYSRRPVVFIID